MHYQTEIHRKFVYWYALSEIQIPKQRLKMQFSVSQHISAEALIEKMLHEREIHQKIVYAFAEIQNPKQIPNIRFSVIGSNSNRSICTFDHSPPSRQPPVITSVVSKQPSSPNTLRWTLTFSVQGVILVQDLTFCSAPRPEFGCLPIFRINLAMFEVRRPSSAIINWKFRARGRPLIRVILARVRSSVAQFK